ncbi:MAG: hypothetical protein OXH49_00285 [Gemmatimonadetes bacterium]|nr:hypothetical protein [Gemmatimonadota bacterium]
MNAFDVGRRSTVKSGTLFAVNLYSSDVTSADPYARTHLFPALEPKLRSASAISLLFSFVAATAHGATAAQEADTAAYLDETARRLVLGVKAARDTARLGIDSYTGLTRERVNFQAPALRRDRPWVNGERTTRIRWSRTEPSVVHVVGSRLRHPGIGPNDRHQFFPGLGLDRYAANPLWDPFVLGATDAAEAGEGGTLIRSPLGSDAERYYQYRSDDTLSVQLADGRSIDVVAVTVIPRIRSIRLVSAIMWVDRESFNLVRVASRPAKRVDSELSWQLRHDNGWSLGLAITADDPGTDQGSARARPGIFERVVSGAINGLMAPLELDITAMVVDYGLWELKHWLPRSVALEAHMTVRMDDGADADVVPTMPVAFDWTLEIEDIRERGAEAPAGTPATAVEALERWQQPGDSIEGDLESADPDDAITITPEDRAALTESTLLPPTIWEDRSGPVDPELLAGIASDLAAIGTGEGGPAEEEASTWFLEPPVMTLRLLRYNPVEGVSVGTRVLRDFGRSRVLFTTRLATRDLAIPDMDLTFQRDRPGHRLWLSAYRDLRSGELDAGGGGGSLGAILTEADSTAFHWSTGASLRILPGGGQRNWLSLTVFGERDTEIDTGVQRDRFGASIGWRPWWGGRDGALAGGGRTLVRGSMGDNPHVRAIAEAVLIVPLGGGRSLGMQGGAAAVWGDPAPLDLWNLGSSANWLRGHRNSVREDRVWGARLDLQQPVRFLRASVFGDWVSTGDDDLYAAGVGLVFMDGIVRLDLAKGFSFGRVGRPDAVLRLHLLGDTFF